MTQYIISLLYLFLAFGIPSALIAMIIFFFNREHIENHGKYLRKVFFIMGIIILIALATGFAWAYFNLRHIN